MGAASQSAQSQNRVRCSPFPLMLPWRQWYRGSAWETRLAKSLRQEGQQWHHIPLTRSPPPPPPAQLEEETYPGGSWRCRQCGTWHWNAACTNCRACKRSRLVREIPFTRTRKPRPWSKWVSQEQEQGPDANIPKKCRAAEPPPAVATVLRQAGKEAEAADIDMDIEIHVDEGQ